MNQEPVNIMGVVAFPNPDPEKRVIRFIDSSYNTLFTLPDGGNIVFKRFDGSQSILPCTYIDDCHAKIGNSVYHICEFAENAERGGAIYTPEHPKASDICDSYEIYQMSSIRDTDYAFRSYEEAGKRIRPTDYKRAYAGVLAPKVTLEDLWMKHNNRDNRPFGREMRSMSISDVVILHRDGQSKAYYADTFGFQEIKRFLPKERTAPKKERGEAR